MQIALWVIDGLLALAFVGAGVNKLTRPRKVLVSSGFPWLADFSDGFVRFIAIAEIVGAVGLVVPGLTRIAPVLGPIAAVGLLVIMIGAVVTHLRRRENPTPAAVLAVLLVASVALALGVPTP